MMVLPLVVVTDAMIVESSLFETAPTTYAAGTTFALNAYASVAGLLGEIKIYRSLQAGNIGNTPASSPTWWVYSSSTFEVHDISKLYYPLNYKVTDLATHSIYICNVANGSYRPLDPISNPTWLALTTPTPALPAKQHQQRRQQQPEQPQPPARSPSRSSGSEEQ